MTQYHYRHYGLTLGVNRALPNATLVEARAADVNVQVLEPGETAGAGLAWVMPDPSISFWRTETDTGTWLRVRYVHGDEWLEFVVDGGGTTIWMTRSRTVQLNEAVGLLLGPVFSCVLVQRGLTCLHAAVIGLDGKAIALVGQSGAGKSTLALFLVQHGGDLISDDVAVLSEVGGRVTVAAGAPRLKLPRDVACSLLGSFESLEPIWSEERAAPPKRYFAVEPGNATTAEGGQTLDLIYILAPWSETVSAPAPSVRELTPRHALAKLMAHRHVAYALQMASHRRDFEVLARLAETAPACDLARPAGLETTEQTVAVIASDVRKHA